MAQSAPTAPRLAVELTCRPFMTQITTVPVVLSRQRMSVLPSPLKSPVSTIDQLLGTVPRPAVCVICPLLTSQIATLAVVPSRHRMSLLVAPTPLKSDTNDLPIGGHGAEAEGLRHLQAVQHPDRHRAG